MHQGLDILALGCFLELCLPADNSGRSTLPTYEELAKKFFGDSISACIEAMSYLQKYQLVKVLEVLDGVEAYSVMLTGAGRAYFLSAKVSREELVKRRLWELFIAVVSGSIGVVIGYFIGRASIV